MRPYEFHPAAEAEYLWALHQYATKTGPEAAEALYTAVKADVDRIRTTRATSPGTRTPTSENSS